MFTSDVVGIICSPMDYTTSIHTDHVMATSSLLNATGDQSSASCDGERLDSRDELIEEYSEEPSDVEVAQFNTTLSPVVDQDMLRLKSKLKQFVAYILSIRTYIPTPFVDTEGDATDTSPVNLAVPPPVTSAFTRMETRGASTRLHNKRLKDIANRQKELDDDKRYRRQRAEAAVPIRIAPSIAPRLLAIVNNAQSLGHLVPLLTPIMILGRQIIDMQANDVNTNVHGASSASQLVNTSLEATKAELIKVTSTEMSRTEALMASEREGSVLAINEDQRLIDFPSLSGLFHGIENVVVMTPLARWEADYETFNESLVEELHITRTSCVRHHAENINEHHLSLTGVLSQESCNDDFLPFNRVILSNHLANFPKHPLPRCRFLTSLTIAQMDSIDDEPCKVLFSAYDQPSHMFQDPSYPPSTAELPNTYASHKPVYEPNGDLCYKYMDAMRNQKTMPNTVLYKKLVTDKLVPKMAQQKGKTSSNVKPIEKSTVPSKPVGRPKRGRRPKSNPSSKLSNTQLSPINPNNINLTVSNSSSQSSATRDSTVPRPKRPQNTKQADAEEDKSTPKIARRTATGKGPIAAASRVTQVATKPSSTSKLKPSATTSKDEGGPGKTRQRVRKRRRRESSTAVPAGATATVLEEALNPDDLRADTAWLPSVTTIDDTNEPSASIRKIKRRSSISATVPPQSSIDTCGGSISKSLEPMPPGYSESPLATSVPPSASVFTAPKNSRQKRRQTSPIPPILPAYTTEKTVISRRQSFIEISRPPEPLKSISTAVMPSTMRPPPSSVPQLPRVEIIAPPLDELPKEPTLPRSTMARYSILSKSLPSEIKEGPPQQEDRVREFTTPPPPPPPPPPRRQWDHRKRSLSPLPYYRRHQISSDDTTERRNMPDMRAGLRRRPTRWDDDPVL